MAFDVTGPVFDRGGSGARFYFQAPTYPVFVTVLLRHHLDTWPARVGNAAAVRALDAELLQDVRALICDELRPGVYAQWADPRERLR